MTGDRRHASTRDTIKFEIDIVQLGHADLRLDHRYTFTAAVGAGKWEVLATSGDATQGVFCRGVINLDGTVIAVAPARVLAGTSRYTLVHAL